MKQPLLKSSHYKIKETPVRPFIAALLFSLPIIGFAGEPNDLQPLPTEPPLPGATNDDTEPQITIKQKGTSKVEEYRVRGRLYMIKVTPYKGHPYYLVDTRGDGHFNRQNSLDTGVKPPMWVIHKW